MIKRIALLTAKVLAGFVVFVSLLIGIMYWQSSRVGVEYRQFSVLESGDGAHVLTIETANPVTPYGPHYVTINIVEAEGEELVVEKKAQLSNDGASIDENNIVGRWVDTNTAIVCIRGDEQKDARLVINVQARIVSESREQC